MSGHDDEPGQVLELVEEEREGGLAFETMYDEIQLPRDEHVLQFGRPQALGVKVVERLGLVLVPESAQRLDLKGAIRRDLL